MDYSGFQQYRIDNCGAGGLRYDRLPWQLGEREWQEATNVSFTRGGVQRTKGWVQLGSAIADVSVADDNLPVAGFGYVRNTGQTHLIVVTLLRTYEFSGSAWGNIQGGGNFSGNAITTDMGFEMLRGNLYIAPGANAIRKWNGTDATHAALGGTPPNCRDIAALDDRLLLGRIRTSGLEKTIRASSEGNDALWPTDGNHLYRLERTPHPLVRMKRTSGRVWCFKAMGISELTQHENPWWMQEELVADGIGLGSGQTIAEYLGTDYFVGLRGVYRMAGGNASEIGQAVNPKLLKQVGGVGETADTTTSRSIRACVFAHADPDLDEIAFASNDSDGTITDPIYCYSPRWNTWSRKWMGSGLQLCATGYLENIAQDGIAGIGRLRSFFSVTNTTRRKNIYRFNDGVDYITADGFPVISDAKSGWLDMGTLKRKQFAAYMPVFDRVTGTTMTINLRFYDDTTDTRPATGNKLRTKTLVLDGTNALLELENASGRWVEVEIQQNSNNQDWRLVEHRFLYKEMDWH